MGRHTSLLLGVGDVLLYLQLGCLDDEVHTIVDPYSIVEWEKTFCKFLTIQKSNVVGDDVLECCGSANRVQFFQVFGRISFVKTEKVCVC